MLLQPQRWLEDQLLVHPRAERFCNTRIELCAGPSLKGLKVFHDYQLTLLIHSLTMLTEGRPSFIMANSISAGSRYSIQLALSALVSPGPPKIDARHDDFV